MFKNFISLGNYCGVAASMSKLGIRNASGPFDWFISSDFEGVLGCLQNDFEDFLKMDHLWVDESKASFRDIKYGFCLGHEVKTYFEREYASICEKYMRRISVFREQIRQKTCFIRAVYNEKELEYIQNNNRHIESIIKKGNPDNEIIYIVSKVIAGSEGLCSPFFVVDSLYNPKNRIELRALFDSNEALLNFCINNMDEKIRYKNIVFDLRKENRELEYRYDIMNKIDKINMNEMSIPDRISIYGAGRIGKYFYNKVKNKCQVCLFIDKSPKGAVSYEGVPVIRLGKALKEFQEIPIVITPCYEFEEIKTNLLNVYGDMNVISLTDFFVHI